MRTKELPGAGEALLRDNLLEILEASSDFISTATPDGVVVHVNPAGRRMTGLPPDELPVGRPIAFFHPPWAFEPIRDEGLPCALRDGVWTGETALLHAGGREIPVSQMIMVHRDPGGAVRFLSTIVRDISELRETQDALKASETWGRSVFDASPMGIHLYRVDADGQLVFTGANPAADRILGIDNTSFVGRTITEAFPPLAGTEIPSRDLEAARSGRSWRTEQISYADGVIDGAFEVYAFQTAPGRMAAMFLDITERKRVEDEHRRLGAIIENSTDFIALADVDGRVEYVNAAGLRMVGLPSVDGVRGTWMGDFLPEERRGRLVEVAMPEVAARGYFSGDGYLRRFDGDGRIPVEFRLFLVRDGSGNPTHQAVVASDVTARRAAERERERLEAQLAHAQRLEAVGRLAGGIAHDFNNVLTAIIGYTELLDARVSERDPLHLFIAEIGKAAARAAGLTNQLLAFSRKQIIAPRVLDMNRACEDARRMLERIIGEDVELEFRPGPSLWAVRADPSQLDQILVNFAVNARDAMPDGGRLTIETSNVRIDAGKDDAAPGPYVRLSIEDDGCGMDAATRSRIFEPFFTTKAPGVGTGLGLATVHGIVYQNGGFVSVWSEPGRGSRFDVYLPAAPGAGVETGEAPRSASGGGTETILLVEDEE